MSLTPEQKAAVYTSSSVIVVASAGTGKTHLLTERFLFYLQNRNISPLQIVAVTFTEKAARELRSRIRGLIKENLPDRFYVLAELEAAPISTIHALAGRICQENSEVAGIPANFAVLEDAKAKIWLQEGIEAALANLPPQCFTDIPYSLMKETINCLLNDPYTAEKALQQGIQDWEALINLGRKEALKKLFNHDLWQKSRDILLKNIGNSGDKLETIRQDVVVAIEELEEGNYSNHLIAVLDKIKLNVGSKKNWQDITIVKNALKEIRELTKEVIKEGLIDLKLSEADARLQKMLPALTEAYRDVTNHLTQLKQQARVLTFADLEIYALKALANPQVREYYQQRWRVFLVDEFQDTNPTQAELLKALTSNVELTIVGDIKQSIYGFRRADIRVFADFRENILQNQGKEVVLSTSFRTHQPLITQINQIFQPLLGENQQDLVAYREFSPNGEQGSNGDGKTIENSVETFHETSLSEKFVPYIQVFAVASDKETDKSQRQRVEAYHIAARIEQILDNKTLVHDKQSQTLRPIEPGDILVLTRTWSPLEIYGEAISALGIPIAPAGGGNLLTTREAKDCWALLRFLADTQDNIALVAVLRSPWFAISDRILFQIAQTFPRQDKEDRPSWWESIQSSDYPELEYPVRVLTELLEQRDIDPPSRLLQKSDRLTGYTAIISNLAGGKRRLADWKGFREFIKELEAGTQDIFGVVRDLKQLYDNEAQIARPTLEIDNAVALMTIYAAKGLERSLVVVADLNKEKPPSYPTVYFSREWGVAVKSKDDRNNYQKPVLYKWLENQKQNQESVEALRVLYVALTRARDYLILTANQEDKGDLKLLSPGLAAAEIPIEIIPFEAKKSFFTAAPLPPIPNSSPALLINSVGSGIFELPVTALTEYARCPYRFQFQYLQGHPGVGEGIAYGMEIGSLVHKALEHNITNTTRLTPFCSHSLSQETVTEALDLVADFLNSNTYKIFRDTAIKKEHPVNLKIGKINFSGVVDLLGKDWLLDYKSDRLINPEHHRFQLWAYSQALGYNHAYIAYLRHNYVYSFEEINLDAISFEAEQLVTEIVAGNYQPKPSIENCSICPYNSLCKFNISLISDR
ncbi:putative helicase [Hyella patelloides LEGE 07179]|uniref:DNA 3'-5' helicase n=1 Tax=Hyella patelloides LEGE 07179 TaxID=945734 RepID=A0A563VRQ5_9CYAN|nr:UvrD-helicase domain-containing protein [Hyella patelloides]VEP14101.1 putative helicase [Hyella patelloides LEGE 07179]